MDPNLVLPSPSGNAKVAKRLVVLTSLPSLSKRMLRFGQITVRLETRRSRRRIMSGSDFRNIFFRLFYLTFHTPSFYFHSYRTQSRLSRPPDVARTSCSIPRNGLQTTSGRNP